MRAAFDQTMAVRYGSRSETGPPGDTYVSGVQCKVIPQNEITQGQFDFTFTDAWVTVDAVELTGPKVTSPGLGLVYTDQLAADEVEFEREPGVWYSVCRKERVLPFGRPAYWRYLLLPLLKVAYPPWPPPVPLPCPSCPAPPDPVGPGPNCGVPAVLTQFQTYTVKSNSGYFEGHYRLSIQFGSDIRFRLVEPISPDVQIVVKQTAVLDSCCNSWPTFVLTKEGLHCKTFPRLYPSVVNRQFCFFVQSLTGEGPATITVAIETGVC